MNTLDLNGGLVSSRAGALAPYASRLEWLMRLVGRVDRVAHFGCSIGEETLALMHYLAASEVIGLDIDADSIRQAQNDVHNLRDDIRRIKDYLRFYPRQISATDRQWWENQVPMCFKTDLLNVEQVRFLIGDITQPVDLPSNHFDLAFCDFVLHHIWYANEDDKGAHKTQFAVHEMARVAKLGGKVAAFELIQYSDRPKLRFADLFESAGLRLLHAKEIKINDPTHDGVVAEFVCEKPR